MTQLENAEGALLLVDLAGLSRVHDSRTASAFSALVARVLQSCFHRESSLVPLPVHQFLIIIPGHDALENFPRMLDTVADLFSKPFPLENQLVEVRPAVGVAQWPSDGNTFEVLRACAEEAVSYARDADWPIVRFYDGSTDRRQCRKQVIRRDLRNALNNHELSLEYQPIVDLHTGHVRSVEALIRWRHPRIGIVHPCEFVRIAEELGAIGAIDRWVVQQACAQYAMWRELGHHDMRIAINSSAAHLADGQMLETIDGSLRRHSMPAENLELEITESARVKALGRTLATVRSIRARGLHVSLDDFGTEYATLQRACEFAADKIKIDRSFMGTYRPSVAHAGAVKAVVVLARHLGLRIIAEGVETSAHYAFAVESGCDYGQGWFFSRPVPAADVERFFHQPFSLAPSPLENIADV